MTSRIDIIACRGGAITDAQPSYATISDQRDDDETIIVRALNTNDHHPLCAFIFSNVGGWSLDSFQQWTHLVEQNLLGNNDLSIRVEPEGFKLSLPPYLGMADFVLSDEEESYYVLTEHLSSRDDHGLVLPYNYLTKPDHVQTNPTLLYDGIWVDGGEKDYCLPFEKPLTVHERVKLYLGIIDERKILDRHSYHAKKEDNNVEFLDIGRIGRFSYVTSEDRSVVFAPLSYESRRVIYESLFVRLTNGDLPGEFAAKLLQSFLMMIAERFCQLGEESSSSHWVDTQFIFHAISLHESIRVIETELFKVKNLS